MRNPDKNICNEKLETNMDSAMGFQMMEKISLYLKLISNILGRLMRATKNHELFDADATDVPAS